MSFLPCQYFSLCKKRSDLTCDVTILTIEMTSNISTMFAGTVLVFLSVSHQRAVANPSCFVLFIYLFFNQTEHGFETQEVKFHWPDTAYLCFSDWICKYYFL